MKHNIYIYIAFLLTLLLLILVAWFFTFFANTFKYTSGFNVFSFSFGSHYFMFISLLSLILKLLFIKKSTYNNLHYFKHSLYFLIIIVATLLSVLYFLNYKNHILSFIYYSMFYYVHYADHIFFQNNKYLVLLNVLLSRLDLIFIAQLGYAQVLVSSLTFNELLEIIISASQDTSIVIEKLVSVKSIVLLVLFTGACYYILFSIYYVFINKLRYHKFLILFLSLLIYFGIFDKLLYRGLAIAPSILFLIIIVFIFLFVFFVRRLTVFVCFLIKNKKLKQ